jgi:hypothetical protein
LMLSLTLSVKVYYPPLVSGREKFPTSLNPVFAMEANEPSVRGQSEVRIVVRSGCE